MFRVSTGQMERKAGPATPKKRNSNHWQQSVSSYWTLLPFYDLPKINIINKQTNKKANWNVATLKVVWSPPARAHQRQGGWRGGKEAFTVFEGWASLHGLSPPGQPPRQLGLSAAVQAGPAALGEGA